MSKSKSGKKNSFSKRMSSAVKTLDKQNRSFAELSYKAGIADVGYSVLDGTNLSINVTKYWIDVLCTNSLKNSADVMHDWLLSPAGIAITAVQSTSIILFSILGNYFDENDTNKIKSWIATLFPYFRELKGLKNGYRGIRSTIQVMNRISGKNINFLILPLALPLGVVSVINRIWKRYLDKERTGMIKANLALYQSLEKAQTLSQRKYKWFFSNIKRQSDLTQFMGFVAAIYGGAVDSLYLYVGILTLSSFSWPILVFMAGSCIIYSLSCIATRLYEEYDSQCKLEITQANIELALYSKKQCELMDELFQRLQFITEELIILKGNAEHPGQENPALLKFLNEERQRLTTKLRKKLNKLSKKKGHLQSLIRLSYTSAFLRGLKNGLAAYGALTSSLFLISTILLLTSAPFPAFIAVACVVLGLIFLVSFVCLSLIQNYKQHKKENNPNYEALWHQLNVLSVSIEPPCEENSSLNVKKEINDELSIKPPTQYFFQEWFEFFRSMFSGLSKGPKSIDYFLGFFQHVDAEGHYHDTSPMMFLALIMSCIYAVFYALRSHARSFGKPPIVPIREKSKSSSSDGPGLLLEEVENDLPNNDQLNLDSLPSSVSPTSVSVNDFAVNESSSSRGSGASKLPPDSRENRFYGSQFSFFSKKSSYEKQPQPPANNDLESPLSFSC